MKDIPAIIKAARIRCGYTQKELAERVGYTDGCNPGALIKRWESGERPVPLEKIRPLAAALNLTLDDLIP